MNDRRFWLAWSFLFSCFGTLSAFFVPDREPPKALDVSGTYAAYHGESRQLYTVTVAKNKDGSYATKWVDFNTGDVRFAGKLVLADAVWTETYEPSVSRCEAWRWHVFWSQPLGLEDDGPGWWIERQ